MKEIAYKILWSTIEDYVGLWEILWELNSVLTQNSSKENQDKARMILSYFLEQKLVVFYKNKWGSDEIEIFHIHEATKFLQDEKYWQAPELHELCIKIGSTEKGEKFYNEKLIDKRY